MKWVEWGGVGAMETTGHPGIQHAIWHQVLFTLGACQSKKRTCLWRSAGSSGASLYPRTEAPTTYAQPFRSSTPPFPLSFHVLSVLSFCSPFPPATCLFKSSVHCPQKLFPYPLLISASSYASQNLNLEKGEPQKELSFTFANQIRFKMVRRHESHS